MSVTLRVGTSFISTSQAHLNINSEIPDGVIFKETVKDIKQQWREKLEQFYIQNATQEERH
ncbi:hypothetical protein H0H87_002996, partial [Tephrocybe sp. NHM501043]